MQRDQSDVQGLQRLSKTNDFEVAPDDTDVRGWTVVGRDGERLGEIDDLLIDPVHMKVAQFDVDLEGGDHIHVPAADAQIDGARREVQIAGYTAGAYRTAATDDAMSADRDERLTRTEEELRVGTRSIDAGEVVVGKHVEVEHRQVPVSLKREEIVIERRPVNHETGTADFGNDEIRVPLTAEEAVVDKRAVVKEELVIGKRVIEEQTTVEADLRREEFDVDETNVNRKRR